MPSGGSLGDRQRPQGRTARGGYASPVAAEIERKFLLDEVPDRLQGRSGRWIEQGYLTKAEEVEVRLRREEDRHRRAGKRGAGGGGAARGAGRARSPPTPTSSRRSGR